MNYLECKNQSVSGFTLIEIILTLVVASILGAILIQVMGANYSGSAQNLTSRREGFEVRQQLESITKDYRMWLETYPNQSIVEIKMILDGRLARTGNKENAPETDMQQFLDHILHHRFAADGQHFLGLRFGGR